MYSHLYYLLSVIVIILWSQVTAVSLWLTDQGFIQACFGGSPPPKKNLKLPHKNVCHIGNYNLNIEAKSNANYSTGFVICHLRS